MKINTEDYKEFIVKLCKINTTVEAASHAISIRDAALILMCYFVQENPTADSINLPNDFLIRWTRAVLNTTHEHKDFTYHEMCAVVEQSFNDTLNMHKHDYPHLYEQPSSEASQSDS